MGEIDRILERVGGLDDRAVAVIREWAGGLERRVDASRIRANALRHELETVIEIVNQLNSYGFDLARIDAYLLRTVMGQCSVPAVTLLRQASFESRRLVVTAGGESFGDGVDSFGVSTEDLLAQVLKMNLRMISLAEDCVRGFDEIRELRDRGFELIVPLVKSDEGGRRGLVGFIAVGRKFSGSMFGDQDERFFSLLADVATLIIHNAQLHYASIVDGLTQTYSRSYFDMRLAQAVERSLREEIPLTLVMLDLDDFKHCNDTWGHQAGDEVLRAVSGALSSAVRDTDLVARYGGEEFCIIFPSMNKKHAAVSVENLRGKIADMLISDGRGGTISVTASFGVAACPDDGTDRRTLVARADEAMYRAKANGKNTVVIF